MLILRTARTACAAALVFVPACSSPEPPGDDGGPTPACPLTFIGDPSAALEIEVTVLRPGPVAELLHDGGDATLMFPPQGGRVVFAGVRARNVDPCAVRLAGALRDPISKQVRLDNRIINLKESPEGFGETDPADISSFANIAACPNQWSDQDLFDKPYELTVSLTDRAGRQAKVVSTVVPRCDEAGIEGACRCICDVDYVLGAACDDGGLAEADAGSEGGTP